MESQVPGAPSAQPPAGREGCGRRAFIGCGVVALLFCAVVVGLLLYVRRNPVLLTDLMMRQIESHYGPDVTEQDKSDLRTAYAEFRTAVSEKRVNRAGVERVQMTFSGPPGRSSQLDREQAHALTRAFREAAGHSPGAPAPAASPLPEPTRSP